jgi:hypothetical protein
MKRRAASTPWWAWLAGALALVGAIAIGLYFARTGKPPVAALPGTTGLAPSATSAPAGTPVEHPIEQAAGAGDAGSAVLPSLDASDAAALDALSSLIGAGGLGALINPEHVVQRIVATIDGLPRQKVASDAFPVRGAGGVFVARKEGERSEIDARNFARYAAYARVAQAIDAKALVTWYAHSYPLFQQAYRELGYPDGYFNDRLVFVIDHLLATPDIAAPLALKQPNVNYEFADPALESRSVGQKMLLRSGPENEAAIKAKLREIRAALTGQELPPG